MMQSIANYLTASSCCALRLTLSRLWEAMLSAPRLQQERQQWLVRRPQQDRRQQRVQLHDNKITGIEKTAERITLDDVDFSGFLRDWLSSVDVPVSAGFDLQPSGFCSLHQAQLDSTGNGVADLAGRALHSEG